MNDIWKNSFLIRRYKSDSLIAKGKLPGDSARLNSGELGSALFGLANDDFLPLDIVVILFGLDVTFVNVEFGVFDPLPLSEQFKLVLFGNAQPGLYDCVVFDAPGW